MLDEPAAAGHFGHAVHRSQLIADEPVLDAAQLTQVVIGSRWIVIVFYQVPVDMPNTGALRPEPGYDIRRQDIPGAGQPFADPGARPVDIHCVIKDHIHHAETKRSLGANVLDVGQGAERRAQRVGHLVVHYLGSAPRPGRQHDHLVVGEIRNRVQLEVDQRHVADKRDKRRHHQHDERVIDAVANQTTEAILVDDDVLFDALQTVRALVRTTGRSGITRTFRHQPPRLVGLCRRRCLNQSDAARP